MIKRIVFSTTTMGVLLVLYALAMAEATFMENDYGTPVAKELIYNSWWFELIMIVLVVNFLGNISRYKLYRKGKWPLLVFHLAFLFMFTGGAITRYISFDGTMHIREGESENKIISEATFFKVEIADSTAVRDYPDQQANFISRNTPAFFRLLHRRFERHYDFEGKKIGVQLLDLIPRAQDSIIPDNKAPQVLHLVTIEDGWRKNVYISSGMSKTLQGVEVGFNKRVPEGVAINVDSGGMHITSALPARYMVMATRQNDSIRAINTNETFHLRSLYNISMGPMFVVPDAPRQGRIVQYEGDLKKDVFAPDLVIMRVQSDDDADTVAFFGGKGITGFQTSVHLKNYRVALGYGSRNYYTPFSLWLLNFELQKYPGSSAPSSYASQVVVNDAGVQIPFRIYMNHTLDHKGFRFFQSSYDADEKGTILSVNHDATGTTLTYIGYTMLFTGMFFTLFWKGTRFSILKEQLRSLSLKRTITTVILLLIVPFAFSQKQTPHSCDNAPATIENGIKSIHIDKQHATAFGYLPVQNFDGRIEPANTLALEILRKLYHHDTYEDLDANQFLLAVTSKPLDWIYAPLISVGKRGGVDLLKHTRTNAAGVTSFINLLKLDTAGNTHFLLEEEYNHSFAKRAAEQDNYDKEVIELNDKMQVAQMLINGMYLRIIPVAGDVNNAWTAVSLMDSAQTSGELLVLAYYHTIQQARQTGNWTEADRLLQQIKRFQKTSGAAVMPLQTKLNWEVRFNSWNLFFELMIFYSIAGSLLLIISFVRLFNTGKWVRSISVGIILLLVMASIVQAFGLAVRWYISGHAPWSSGYEAVMFISLIGLVSGLLLYRNSNGFIPAAGALIAVILMGFAYGGAQMNPQITPLVPVLKSYWLMVHVAIITASYGFFGLSALLGMLVLLLHIANNSNRQKLIEQSLRELTIVNEMSMTIGLFMLTSGTFLGGMWANESWGRYWSWDPKETWAFVSVIVYAFVLHARLIPGISSKFLFNFLSLISFSSVVMTYFGVNYYLSGLHSYAKGDPMPIPSWIYVTLAVVASVSVVALIRYNKLSNSLQSSVKA